MNIILFDAQSTSPVSQIIAVAPGDCVLINAWGLGAGEVAQVYRALVALGNLPQQQSGSCLPPPQVTPATIQTEAPFFPCNVPVQVGEDDDISMTSVVIQQPGFYRVHLTPAALGNATVEAVVLTGREACKQAADQCCCLPETFWSGTSLSACLTITPGGTAGHSPTFDIDGCCLLHQFPALPAPVLTDELVVLSGGQCFRSTIAQVFDPAVICTALGNYLLQLPAPGDTIVVVDAGAGCVRRDAETLVEFFETPWTGISVTAALTITPGGINGHGPTFAYDLCADLQAIAACACEPDPGDLVPIVQGGSCVLATWPTIDVCDQMGALPVGALVAGDTVMLRDVGGNCKQVDATALAIPFDGGVITTPILAADGACATPSYSFTSAPDSGMFFDPASPVTCNGDTAVVIGWQNCTSRVDVSDSIRLTAANTDFFEVGCSIQGTSATGPVQFEATTGSMSLNAGTSLTANAGTLLNLNAGDLASLVGGTGVSIISLVNDIHLNADTGNIILQSNSGIFTVSGAVGAPQIVGPDGSCANPTYSFNSDGTTGMFFDPLTPALMLGHDTCDSFIRIGDIIRIEAANGDFVEYGASMLTQIAGGTRIQLSQAAPIVGRGVSNLFSLFAAGDTQAALIIGGNATAIAAAGEGWLRGGDSNFAGQNGASVVMDGGDANAAGAVAGDAIIAAGRGTLGGTPGNILLRTNALTRFSVNAAGALGIGDPAVFGAAGQVITSAGAGAPPAWATPTVPVGSTFNWGANNINSAADTRVMTPGFLDGLVNTNTPRGFVAPRAGMLRNLFARHNIAAGNGNAVTYTIRLNGVATALTVNLATAAIGSAGNTVNTVAVAQGDLIELLTIKAVAIGSGVLDAMVTCQFN